MNFLHPNLALAAAIGVTIPIIIHLLMRRRRTPVPWAAMRFLLEAYKKQKRRMQVEQLLLLASRCLLVALIGAAIAGPLFGKIAEALSGPRAVVLVIDNSLASGAVGAGGKSALEEAKAGALAALAQLSAERGDTAGLVTLGAPADATILPPSADIGAVKAIIEKLSTTDSQADLPGALERIASGFAAEKPAPGVTRQVVLFGELRAGSADAREPLASLANADVSLLSVKPAQEPLDNVSVTGLTPLRSVLIGAGEGAAGSDPVTVELSRAGPGVNQAASSLVNIRLVRENSSGWIETTGEPAGSAVVRWTPGQETARVSVPTSVPASTGGARLVLRASVDRDAIEADNGRLAVIQARDRVQVGLLDNRPASVRTSIDSLRPADWFALALDPAGGPAGLSGSTGVRVGYEPPRQLASGGASLSGYDALFVPDPRELGDPEWAKLRAFVDAGGLVVLTPPADQGPQLWTEAFARSMGLSWTFEREPRALTPPGRIDAGKLAQPRTIGNALFGLISAEAPELAKAVSVQRVLVVTAPAEDVALGLADGSPLVLAAKPGGSESGSRGIVVLISTALDLTWTDLPAKPLSVPIVQELVRQGVGQTSASAESIAGLSMRTPSGTSELRLSEARDASTQTIAIDSSGNVATPVRRAGVGVALDARGREIGLMAINPDVRAGQTRPLAVEAAEAWLSKAAGVNPSGGARFAWLDDTFKLPLGAAGGGSSKPRDSALSLWLLIAAAVVGVIETALARLVSHASRTRRTSAAPSISNAPLQEAA